MVVIEDRCGRIVSCIGSSETIILESLSDSRIFWWSLLALASDWT